MTEEKLKEALLAVMRARQGREVLWHIMSDLAELQGRSYRSGDTHGTAFREGSRHVGTLLALELEEAAPDEFIEMHIEMWQERRLERERAKSDGTDTGADTVATEGDRTD